MNYNDVSDQLDQLDEIFAIQAQRRITNELLAEMACVTEQAVYAWKKFWKQSKQGDINKTTNCYPPRLPILKLLINELQK